jgi:hypothetical protein
VLLKHEAYAALKLNESVTPAGLCYLLRGLDMAPVLSEAESVLDWLVRNGLATVSETEGQFGFEYKIAPKATEE